MKDSADSHKDLQRVWQCIHDILCTVKCHQPQVSGQSLVLKPVFLQVNKLVFWHEDEIMIMCSASVESAQSKSQTFGSPVRCPKGDSNLQVV